MPDILNPSATEPVTAAQLKQVADEAYEKYPGSCSHAVWHVIKRYIPDQEYRTANSLVAFLKADKRWRETPVSQPNGHVIVVYPGAAKPAGGYAYTSGGKSQTMRARGMYPLAMSTSLGGWAGAKSKGDKTIWDPWANDGKFAEVVFWRLDIGAAK
jgi:hypothetical protein